MAQNWHRAFPPCSTSVIVTLMTSPYPYGTVEKLIEDRCRVYARCLNSRCRHSVYLDLERIAAERGMTYDTIRIGAGLQCTKCGHQLSQCPATPYRPHEC